MRLHLRGPADRFQIERDPSEYHLGTLLDPLGGYLQEDPQEEAAGSPHPSVSIGSTNTTGGHMKASQVIARIESAGWKKIRQEGSHAVYEHPKYGRKSTALGVPHKEVNKRRLLDVIEEFHLAEIEQARLAARLEEVKKRPEPARAALAMVQPEIIYPNSTATDQEIRILWAQLHKEHGVTMHALAKTLGINPGALLDQLHHGKPLPELERGFLIQYLNEKERQLKLTRNRAELLKRGYGARIGSSNSIDPFIPVVREAIQKTLDAGVAITDLASTIGIGASVIHGIKSGKVKTIHPGAKTKLAKWYAENWQEEEKPEPPQEQVPSHEVEAREYQATQVSGIDNELAAIQIVLNAVKSLDRITAMRALRYVLERMS